VGMTKLRAWTCGACLLLAILSSAATTSAQARPGRLDPTFGERGRAFTSPHVTYKAATARLAIAPDGSAVLADHGVLVDHGTLIRFRSDGSRDLGFGNKGRLVLSSGTAAEGVSERSFFPGNIAVDGRGRVLAFGEQTDSRETFGPIGIVMFNPLPASSAVVLRFSHKGERDLSFGGGRGFIREDFDLRSELPTEIPLVSTLAGRVDSRDRPLLVAGVATLVSGCVGHSFVSAQPGAVVRLTETGAPDPSFGGGDGISPIEGSTGFRGLQLDAADRPLVGVGRIGGPRSACHLGTTLVRLRQDGERLTSFGTDGVRELRSLSLDVLQSSGAMLLSERRERALILHRLRPDGGRDLRFGENGSARVTLPTGFRARPVAVDERGRILLAGFRRPGPRSDGRRQRPNSFVVIRLRSGGRPDRTFGNDGRIVTPMPRPLRVTYPAAALDPRGRLLLAATVTAPNRRGAGFVLARYLLGP
jgi:uncharacterized delta-60 repeat protein